MRSPHSTPETYKYRSLGLDEIRLIKLAPASQGVELQCEVLHVSIEDRSYEALSYTWGSDKKTHVIAVGSTEIGITTNLYQALYHLRHQDIDRILWADALCINQGDTQERNHQVNYMAQIFSSASEVIIWLGPEQEDIKLALEAFRESDSTIARYGDYYVQSMHSKETRVPDVPRIDEEVISSILALSRRRWFTRLWVVQEATLAKKATIRCGRLSIPFDIILRVTKHWRKNSFIFLPRSEAHRPVFAMSTITSFEHHKAPLLELLRLTKAFESSDPRDRIFGLVSLASDDANLGFEVDYSLSCAGLYTQMAKHWITQLKSPTLLGRAGLALHSGDIDIPSWVPDWSICDRIYTELGDKSFRATRSTTATPRVNDSNGLELSAIFIDNIKVIGKEMLPPGFQSGNSILGRRHSWLKDFSRYPNIGSLFADLNYLSKYLNPYPSGENIEHVKRRTVTFGISGWDKYVDEYQSIYASCQIDPSFDYIPLSYNINTHNPNHFDDLFRSDLKKDAYLSLISAYARCRMLCTTDRGYLGWVPDITRKGDSVFIFPGASVPFVVRPAGDGVYRLIDECYIDGIVCGEALENDPTEKNITLI
ncbi:HET-domain-containing protein [Hypoxylon rubiginosum]|uniref:HET-domain-containing protein n=1 Tax=Hypoxylon rubiginosum TaxID=110542 RepID=A0ACC0CKL3_9PEZI|nr:HET-domain-containing protein [Hypoxylon rubiginosum]